MKRKIGIAMLYLLVVLAALSFIIPVVQTLGWRQCLKGFGAVALLATYVYTAVRLVDSKEEK